MDIDFGEIDSEAEEWPDDPCDMSTTVLLGHTVRDDTHTQPITSQEAKTILFQSIDGYYAIPTIPKRSIVHAQSMQHDPCAANIYTGETFRGACIDSGAEFSVIGADKANAYQRTFGTRQKLVPSPLKFKFGNYLCQSSDIRVALLPLQDGTFLPSEPM